MQVTDEMVGAALRIRDTAMKQTLAARIPESGHFGAIAQDADWLVDALTAALANAWRPIEEAEKDWTSRLLYLPNTGIKIDIGHYDLIKCGWVAFKSLGIVSPTHWMPLPEPPATKEAGER